MIKIISRILKIGEPSKILVTTGSKHIIATKK